MDGYSYVDIWDTGGYKLVRIKDAASQTVYQINEYVRHAKFTLDQVDQRIIIIISFQSSIQIIVINDQLCIENQYRLDIINEIGIIFYQNNALWLTKNPQNAKLVIQVFDFKDATLRTYAEFALTRDKPWTHCINMQNDNRNDSIYIWYEQKMVILNTKLRSHRILTHESPWKMQDGTDCYCFFKPAGNRRMVLSKFCDQSSLQSIHYPFLNAARFKPYYDEIHRRLYLYARLDEILIIDHLYPLTFAAHLDMPFQLRSHYESILLIHQANDSLQLLPNEILFIVFELLYLMFDWKESLDA